MTTHDNRAFRATTPIALATVEAHLDQLLDHVFSAVSPSTGSRS